jgi:GDP-4-dehydro-6-deoxy-D-mannose reductase
MRTLVTGAAGFVGRHLVNELLEHGYDVIPTDLTPGTDGPDLAWHSIDICDREAVRALVTATAPEACIHLAGMSFVPDAASKASLMLSVNVSGTLNLLEAARDIAPGMRVLAVSTAYVYGTALDAAPITEDTPLRPVNLYAISKAAADVAALGFARSEGLPVMTARPSNHTGPGQPPHFVVPALMAQAKAIADGEHAPVMAVGNLESIRAFSDVRDVVRAYRLLLEKGQSGEAYNIGSDDLVTIGDLLKEICGLYGIDPEIRVDPERYRPTDRSPLLDTGLIQAHTGWQPAYKRDETLTAMIGATP